MQTKTNDHSQIFSALGDKTRFRLFELIGVKQQICVSQLAEELSLTPACISQHMKVLADAGLLERKRNGKRVCYQIITSSPLNKAINNMVFNLKGE